MTQENAHITEGLLPVPGNQAGDCSTAPRQQKTPYILVVTRNGHMAGPVMDYAINVADRLKYSILAVHVNTLPFYRDGGRRSRLFASAMQESSELFGKKAAPKSIQVEHLGDAGKIGKVVKRLCHSKRHIEFVVIDQGIRIEEVSSQSPVPVFSVIYTQAKAGRPDKTTYHKPQSKGVSRMSTISRKRHVKNCLVFGALTVGLYTAVFGNQGFVMTYFTKGGIYALLPVAVVFALSYVHGNFTSAFWSALGIEGSKATVATQAEVRQDVRDTADTRKDTRPRAQVNV
jgi:hypothetical protein